MKSLDQVQTILVIPGHKPEWEKLGRDANPDMILWDLEDGVPYDDKVMAREIVARVAQPGDAVRINSEGTRWNRMDLTMFAKCPAEILFLPKFEMVGEMLPFPCVPIIETPAGVSRLYEIMSNAWMGVAIGVSDLCASLRIAPTYGHPMIEYVSCRLLWLATQLGVPAFIGPSLVLGTQMEEASYRLGEYALNMGYTGTVCVHPRQVRPAKDGMKLLPGELKALEEISQLPTDRLGKYGDLLLSPRCLKAARQRLTTLRGFETTETPSSSLDLEISPD